MGGLTSSKVSFVKAISAAVALMMLLFGTTCSPIMAPEEPSCEINEKSTDYEQIETRCDQVDNDCDLVVDLLQPVKENECETEEQGVCGKGYAGCLQGEKVCFAPPPTPEVVDDLDNDCNGLVDDVPTVTERAIRARVMIVPYMWDDNPDVANTLIMLLNQVGIPYDIDQDASDWETAFDQLDQYSLIIMPGYMGGYAFSYGQIEALRSFVSDGGVLVWLLLVPEQWSSNLMSFAGITGGKGRTDVKTVVLDAVPATVWLDSPEEREQTVTEDLEEAPVEVFVYELDSEADAESFGTAQDINEMPIGPTLVRRCLGNGAIYTLGHDLAAFGNTRCYVNCYDPGNDLYAMFLKGAFREGAGGHYVVKHTVPGIESSAMIVSHDVDAPDAHLYGEWGEPGGIQMVKMELKYGVKSTNFVTTDYHVGYYNPKMVQDLCELGVCPEGGHSVLHDFMNEMPTGDCNVTKANYDPGGNPTVCGEVRVCMELLYRVLPEDFHMWAWRTPYLNTPEDLWEVLYNEGVLFDATLGLGDFRTNFPVYLKTYPYEQQWFRGLPMFEFVMTIEDGFGLMLEDGSTIREELKLSTQPKFLATWRYAIRQNARNSAWTVLLVHPSYGLGVGPENLPIKIGSVEQAIITAQENDVLIEQITPLGFFSLGRETAALEVDYGPEGYKGTIHVGENEAPRFSLEFGDHIKNFSAPDAPDVEIRENRVVFSQPLHAGQSYAFTAVVE
ncbi:MAG: hypothetical protein GY847_22155 [Proteobacteria bacterium]|nr:hypothetical protein [Pseudomonadota bacterium]